MRILSTSLALIALAGCAGQSTTRTGFLSSYDGMTGREGHSNDLIFIDPAFRPLNYSQVILEPVVWHPAKDAPDRDAATIQTLTSAFHGALKDQISKDMKLVDSAEPAPPGTLRVRAAITNTRKARWYINAPVQAIGIGLTAVGVPGGFAAPNPGGASEEIEVTDARTGQRMIAIATYNNGMPWNVRGYYESYGHAARAFRLAADLVRDTIKRGDGRTGLQVSR